jgi:hypothetical protein
MTTAPAKRVELVAEASGEENARSTARPATPGWPRRSNRIFPSDEPRAHSSSVSSTGLPSGSVIVTSKPSRRSSWAPLTAACRVSSSTLSVDPRPTSTARITYAISAPHMRAGHIVLTHLLDWRRGEGFEPPIRFPVNAPKCAALGRSATSPSASFRRPGRCVFRSGSCKSKFSGASEIFDSWKY